MSTASVKRAGTREYAIAVLCVATAFGARSLLQPWLGPHVPFIVFYPALLAASWFGGLGPGLVATALSALLAGWISLPPAGQVAISSPADLLSLAIFIAIGVTIAWLNQRVRVAEAASRAQTQLAVARAERLDAIINTTVDAIIVISELGVIEAFNRGAERLFGYRASEAIGQNVSLLMTSPDRDAHDDYLRRYRETGHAAIIGIGRQVTGRRKDGSTFPLHLSVGEMTIDGVRKFTGMLHDLSERVALEQRLRDQAGLAQLGEMAAVLAHEVKNPMAGIRGAVEIVGGGLPVDHPDQELVRDVIGRIDALDRMMRELLLFARPPHPQLMAVDVATLLSNTVRLLRNDPVASGVTIDVHGQAPAVAADPQMLEIVFHNLLVNAAQATNGSGRVDVRVSATDGQCEVSVADNGAGMPADVRERVFTPFFTTKTRGSGLGLATARRFVEAHGGQIRIESPDAGGTRAVIQLPLSTRVE